MALCIPKQQAEKIKKHLLATSMTDEKLVAMSPDQREEYFAQAVDKETAKLANMLVEKSYADIQKELIENWIDTKVPDRRKGGAFARLEALNDLGVLSPDALENFMESFVADQLGISVSFDESKEIGKLTQTVTDAKAKITATNDWTADNRENVVNYWVERKALEDYIHKLNPSSTTEVLTGVSASGALLLSLHSLVNSIGYQTIPTLTQGFVKRVTTGVMTPGDHKTMDRIFSIVGGRFAATKHSADFGKRHLAMAWEIYRKTGYDISRVESLEDGFRVLGEKVVHTLGPTMAESKGITEKFKAGVRGHAEIMTIGFKYLAGGTDTLLANIHRYDTTMLAAKNTAFLENTAGKLKGSMEDRVEFLFKDAMRPDPQSPEGNYIRHAGLIDANKASFTNKDIYKKFGERARALLEFGNASMGKLVVPFIGIPATALGVGIEMAVPIYGVARGARIIRDARKTMEDGPERQAKIAEGTQKMIVSAGGFLAAALVAALLLDDDDYIAPYELNTRSENKLSTTDDVSSNMIRIGGYWISTKYLGPVGLPLSGFMQAKRAWKVSKKGEGIQEFAFGYGQGVGQGILEFPGLKDAYEWINYGHRVVNRSVKFDPEKLAKAMGNFFASRLLGATVTSDVVPMLPAIGIGSGKNETDAFGRPLSQRTDSAKKFFMGIAFGSAVKPDTRNALTTEFATLAINGQMPTITDPSAKTATALKASMGEAEYEKYLATLKQDFAKNTEALIQTEDYQKSSAEEKKKMIKKERQLSVTKELQRKLKEIEPDQATKIEEDQEEEKEDQ